MPIAFHLWCYRQLLGRDGVIQNLETIIGQVANAGFAGVQHFLDSVTSKDQAVRFADLLSKNKLSLAGLFSGASLHDARLSSKTIKKLVDVITRAKKHLEVKTLTLSPDPLPGNGVKSDAQLENQAESLKQLSEQLAPFGVRLLYHFYAPEMADNGREFKRMMRLVTNRYMGVCFDVDAVARSGQIPGDYLDPFAPRVQETHLRSSRSGAWDEVLGDGDVDLQELVELLDDYDFRGWHIVELSREPKTPREIKVQDAMRKSYAYARSLLVSSKGSARLKYRHA